MKIKYAKQISALLHLNRRTLIGKREAEIIFNTIDPDDHDIVRVLVKNARTCRDMKAKYRSDSAYRERINAYKLAREQYKKNHDPVWLNNDRKKKREHARKKRASYPNYQKVISARYLATVKGHATRLFNAARRRNITPPLELISKEQIIERILIGFCPITGEAFDLSPTEVGRTNPNHPSIDQIIPGAGYTVGNTQIISWQANRSKHTGTYQDLIEHCYGVIKTYYVSVTQEWVEPCEQRYLIMRARCHDAQRRTRYRAKVARDITFDIDIPSRHILPSDKIYLYFRQVYCPRSGVQFDVDNHHHTLSIDRIDYTKPYSYDNIQVVATWYNIAKGELS